MFEGALNKGASDGQGTGSRGCLSKAEKDAPTLSRLVSERGVARDLRSDSGPEFVSCALLKWIVDQGIEAALVGRTCGASLRVDANPGRMARRKASMVNSATSARVGVVPLTCRGEGRDRRANVS